MDVRQIFLHFSEGRLPEISPMTQESIPTYALYGEGPTEPDLGFLHLETIPARAALHQWHVRPHRHARLTHVLLLTAGGGTLYLDGETLGFGQAAIIVPMGLVHGFRFTPNADGFVLTLSDGFIADQFAGAAAEVRDILEGSHVIELPEGPPLLPLFRGLDQELRWPGPASRAAVAALVTLILVGLVRAETPTGAAAAHPATSDRLILYRFRRLLERHLADHWRVADYADALGVTPSRLTLVCRRTAGAAPQGLIHARLLLEAKRQLLYTGMSLSEIGYRLGFADPAYFSRFFTQRAGLSPKAYRQQKQPLDRAAP